MKFVLRPAPLKPLPIIVKPIVDELLSSWLQRIARIYRVSSTDILQHFGIDGPHPMRQVDFVRPHQINARLAWGLRTTGARIQRAGHPIPAWRARELVAVDIPFSGCVACDEAWSSKPIGPRALLAVLV